MVLKVIAIAIAAVAIVACIALGSPPLVIVGTAALALSMVLFFPSNGRSRRGGEDDNGSDDGGSPRGPQPRRPIGPTDAPEPDWWPQFEREFADRVRGRCGVRSGATPRPLHGRRRPLTTALAPFPGS